MTVLLLLSKTQVECADVVLLNKTDLLSEQEQQQLVALLRQINPAARLITTEHCRVPVEEVLHTGRFNWEAAQAAPGWVQALSRHEQQQQKRRQKRRHSRCVLLCPRCVWVYTRVSCGGLTAGTHAVPPLLIPLLCLLFL